MSSKEDIAKASEEIDTLVKDKAWLADAKVPLLEFMLGPNSKPFWRQPAIIIETFALLVSAVIGGGGLFSLRAASNASEQTAQILEDVKKLVASAEVSEAEIARQKAEISEKDAQLAKKEQQLAQKGAELEQTEVRMHINVIRSACEKSADGKSLYLKGFPTGHRYDALWQDYIQCFHASELLPCDAHAQCDDPFLAALQSQTEF